MIDARRWTANERQVVREALKARDLDLRDKTKGSRSERVHREALWRRHVIAECLEAIGNG